MDDLVGHTLFASEVVIDGLAHQRGAVGKLDRRGLHPVLPEVLDQLSHLGGLAGAVQALDGD